MAETEQDVLALLACMNMSPGASRAFEVDPANMLGALNQFICNGTMPTEIVLCMPGGTSITVRIWIEDWEIVYSEPTEHPLKTICSARGWRYKDLADAINKAASTVGDNQMATNRHTVCRWFTKDVAPTPHTQRILADELGVPYEMLETHPWPAWLPTNDSGFMVTTMRVQAGGVQLWLAMAQGKKDLAARGAWMQVWLVPEGD